LNTFRERLTLWVLPLALLVGVGCESTINGSGQMKTESRTLGPGIDSVEMSGFGNLLITSGNAAALNVTADDNLLPYIESEVKGSVLKLWLKPGQQLKPSKSLTYNLTLKSLRSLNLSGAEAVAVSPMYVTDLNLQTSGAGSLDFTRLQARSLEVNASGTQRIHLTGECDSQSLISSGAASYDARDFATQNTTIILSGASSIQVRVAKILDVKLSGAGNVLYYGNPKVTKTITGVGNVSPAGH
jgi:hypothetical protein